MSALHVLALPPFPLAIFGPGWWAYATEALRAGWAVLS